MSLTIEDVPEALKTDKSVYPYICRSIELVEANPVVSYYCQIYVLEYILTNKIHIISPENEAFTIKLLENTESIKKSTADESLHKILADKSLSISLIFTFVLKLFNSCLSSLPELTESNKPQVVAKFKATLNFLQLFTIFESEDSIDWSKLYQDATNWSQFNKLNQDKIKVLKFNLSKVLKNQIPYKDEDVVQDDDLEKELNDELEKLGHETKSDIKDDDEPLDVDIGLPKFVDESDKNTFVKSNDLSLPSPPNDISTNSLPSASNEISDINLPGAPHFELDNDDDNVKLPGVPKYLPNDDLTTINKSSSIQVIPANTSPKSKSSSRKPSIPHQKPISTHGIKQPPITKETIDSIIDRNEAISKVQKHAKFAISALNYEDVATAEQEFAKGLELLKLLKENGNE